jgi:hypothetical protein
MSIVVGFADLQIIDCEGQAEEIGYTDEQI